jgi:hypothetical protein
MGGGLFFQPSSHFLWLSVKISTENGFIEAGFEEWRYVLYFLLRCFVFDLIISSLCILN